LVSKEKYDSSLKRKKTERRSDMSLSMNIHTRVNRFEVRFDVYPEGDGTCFNIYLRNDNIPEEDVSFAIHATSNAYLNGFISEFKKEAEKLQTIQTGLSLKEKEEETDGTRDDSL
jgi:hypothetical protein